MNILPRTVHSTELKIVKLNFVYYKKDNENPPDISDLNSVVVNLNSWFRESENAQTGEKQHFKFFFNPCEYKIISNNQQAEITYINCNSLFNQNGKLFDGITVHINSNTLIESGRAISIPGDELFATRTCLFTTCLVHEIGHVLGLHHIFNGFCSPEDASPEDGCIDTDNHTIALFEHVDPIDCQIYDPSEHDPPICNGVIVTNPQIENFMGFVHSHCRNIFTTCQYEKMHDMVFESILHTTIPSNIVYGECKSNEFSTYDITCDFTYDYHIPYYINGNIVVKNGGHLTIKNDIYFANNSGIIVEFGGMLTVDGAKLTKCPLASSWKGIKVAPDLSYVWGLSQPSTEVTLKNEAVISNAVVGIDAVGQVTFFSTFDVGGAKITISSNSSISNCGTGINLGPIFGYSDLSSVTNSLFKNNTYGIQLNGNNGINIIKSMFDENGNDIEAVTSSLKADDNDFNSQVVFINTFPNFYGSTFINNRFYGGSVASSYLLLDAYSNATDFNIHNNQFFGTGVVSLGELDFDIQGNDFHDSPEGTWINDSGLNITNDIHQNKFYDNTYGNSASGVNSVEYLKNCFENTSALSIEVNEGASIELQQGGDDDAAGNCFFASGRVGTGSTSELFDYYVKQGEIPQSCKKPGSGNFAELQAFSDVPFPCGTGLNIYGTLPYIVRNCMYGNGISLQQAINLLKAEILRIQNAANINPWTKRWLIAKYKKCLDRFIKLKAKDNKDQGGRESAIQFLLAQPEFRYQSMAYGLVTETGDMSRARTMLSSLSPSDIGETEFIQAQHTLIDYLSDRKGYNPSSATLSSLYSSGLRKHPLAGFSRSIYRTLTGQKVPVILTHLNGGTKTRSNADIISKNFIQPNPSVDGSVTITIPAYDSDVKYMITIHNMTGKEVYRSNLSESENSLQIDLTNGVYVVALYGNNQSIKTQKWVIVK